MWKKAILPIASVAAMSVSAATLAQSPRSTADQYDYYFGGNVAFLDFNQEDVINDANLRAFYGRLGTHINDFLSAEARLGFGLGDDSVSVLGTRVTADLEHMYGVYARAGTLINEEFYPYVIAGYTRGEVSARSGAFDESETEGDVSFGAGVDYHFRDDLHLNLEYMSYIDKDGAEIEGFSVGVSKSF